MEAKLDVSMILLNLGAGEERKNYAVREGQPASLQRCKGNRKLGGKSCHLSRVEKLKSSLSKNSK